MLAMRDRVGQTLTEKLANSESMFSGRLWLEKEAQVTNLRVPDVTITRAQLEICT